MKNEPIIYEADVEVRFDDMDPYGHVNASRYLDLVITSRWKFAESHLDYTIHTLLERGVGMYLTRSLLHYRQPICGVQSVHVRSFAKHVKANSIVTVSFKVLSQQQDICYAEGEMDLSTIDIESQKLITLPSWCYSYLYKKHSE
jgi:YbgC/YbaW family acyl-CoA thioester hydrolase